VNDDPLSVEDAHDIVWAVIHRNPAADDFPAWPIEVAWETAAAGRVISRRPPDLAVGPVHARTPAGSSPE